MRRLFLGLLLGAGTCAAFACSSSDDSPATDPGADSGPSVLPAMDAAPVDAADASDAAPDAFDAGPQICSTDHFCHSDVPKGQFLRSVWGDGTGVLWAVALEGDLLRWDTTEWKVYKHLSDNEGGVFSVFGTSPTSIWIATDKGLLHSSGTTSATLTFAAVTLPGDGAVFVKSVWGTGPTDLWAVGGTADFDNGPPFKGRALHFNGATWALDTELSAKTIAYDGVWGSPATGVWVKGNSYDDYNLKGVALRRLPGATGTTTWNPVVLPPGKSVSFPDPQEITSGSLSGDTSVWLSGFDGDFSPSTWHGSKVTDGGTGYTWTYTDRGYFARPIFGFWGMGPNDTWAVGQQGYVSHWDGTTWQTAITHVGQNPIGESIWAIWGTSNDDFWVVGDEIALHKTLAGKP